MPKKDERKIVAITITMRDSLYYTTHLYKDGGVEERSIGHFVEGSPRYSLEEPDAIALAQKWGVYYIPNHYAADQDRFDRIRQALGSRDRGFFEAISMMRGSYRLGMTRAEKEARGEVLSPTDGGVVVPSLNEEPR